MTTGFYRAMDGWILGLAGTGASGSWAQTAITSLPGFPYCLTFAAANTLPGANDYSLCTQSIEGYLCAQLAFGTASAKPITIGFWINPQVAGTMAVSITNSANNRTYVTDVPIVSGWQYKTVTIPGDVTGTWLVDNGIGISLFFCFGAGSAKKGSANIWQAGIFLATAATTNFFATSNPVYLTGITVHSGTQGPTAAQSANIVRTYPQELVVCQRYWQTINVSNSGWHGDGNGYGCTAVFPVIMRATPTIDASGITAYNQGGGYPTYSATQSSVQVTTATASGVISTVVGNLKLDARL